MDHVAVSVSVFFFFFVFLFSVRQILNLHPQTEAVTTSGKNILQYAAVPPAPSFHHHDWQK